MARFSEAEGRETLTRDPQTKNLAAAAIVNPFEIRLFGFQLRDNRNRVYFPGTWPTIHACTRAQAIRTDTDSCARLTR